MFIYWSNQIKFYLSGYYRKGYKQHFEVVLKLHTLDNLESMVKTRKSEYIENKHARSYGDLLCITVQKKYTNNLPQKELLEFNYLPVKRMT